MPAIYLIRVDARRAIFGNSDDAKPGARTVERKGKTIAVGWRNTTPSLTACRHLSAGQQAAIVASAQDWATAQKRGGTGANQHKEQTGNLAALQTVAQRAAESGASERTQRMADKVAKASPATWPLTRCCTRADASLARHVASRSVHEA